MEKENKTLKDIEDELLDKGKGESFLYGFSKLKALAIEWVKKAQVLYGINPQTRFWMKRLNITEEDLK